MCLWLWQYYTPTSCCPTSRRPVCYQPSSAMTRMFTTSLARRWSCPTRRNPSKDASFSFTSLTASFPFVVGISTNHAMQSAMSVCLFPLYLLNQQIFDRCVYASSHPVGWRRGIVVSSVHRMNKVNPHWGQLVLWWVTVFGLVYRLGM